MESLLKGLSSDSQTKLQQEIKQLRSCPNLKDLNSKYNTLQEKLYTLYAQPLDENNKNDDSMTDKTLESTQQLLKDTYRSAIHFMRSTPPEVIASLKTRFNKFQFGQLKSEEIFSLGFAIGRLLQDINDPKSTAFYEDGVIQEIQQFHQGLPEIVRILTFQNPNDKVTFRIRHKKTGEFLTGSGVKHNDSRAYLFTRPELLADKARSDFRMEALPDKMMFGILNLVSEEFYEMWDEVYCPANDWMRDKWRRYCFLWLDGGLDNTGYFQFELDAEMKYVKVKSVRYGEYLVAEKDSFGGKRELNLVSEKYLGKVGLGEEDLWWEIVRKKDE